MIPRKNPEIFETFINTCFTEVKIAETTKRFHKNVIFSLGAFKISLEKWNILLENITILD